MDAQEKNNIYDRLLSINFEIAFKENPDPQYINQKIGECHVYIEEVEKFLIRASKEQSVIQRALNDNLASFESKREDLISQNDDIRNLPSIRDREAKANSMLKEELKEIKELQNELSDINNLAKAINLKLKNLNRANSDIRMQLRLMESQIKLGIPQSTDAAARSLAEEMSKSMFGKDSFENVETKAEETQVIDPTETLDINEVLGPDTDKLTDPAPLVGQGGDSPEDEDNPPEDDGADLDEILQMKDGVFDEDLKPEEVTQEIKSSEGGDAETLVEEQKQEPEKTPEKQESSSNPIDVDSLLSQWN